MSDTFKMYKVYYYIEGEILDEECPRRGSMILKAREKYIVKDNLRDIICSNFNVKYNQIKIEEVEFIDEFEI